MSDAEPTTENEKPDLAERRRSAIEVFVRRRSDAPSAPDKPEEGTTT